MRRRRRWLPFVLLGISLALLLAAGAILIVPQFTSPSPGVQVTPTGTAHLPNADATRLEKALNSPDMLIQATVMTPDLASVFLAQGKPAYPAGSTVRVLQGTSKCLANVCEVTSVVTEPGGKRLTFLLSLTNLTGTWLIFSTTQES